MWLIPIFDGNFIFMEIVKKALLAILLVCVGAQFFGPKLNQGELSSLAPFIAETKPSEEVQKIMKQVCFDCHSNVTNYPWYNNITPVNYWIADHVKEGKKEVNFSKWSEYSLKRKEHKFEEIWEEVEEKHMPLNSYTWVHRDANLSEEQIETMVAWAKEKQADYKAQMTQE